MTGYRPLTLGLRRLLFVAGGLVGLAGFQLFVLTDHTARYFAWTIHPGMTAAFLGAGYVSSIFVEVLAARERDFARARIGLAGVLSFTVLTEIATLSHLGKFHFHEPLISAGLAAYAWLAIYTGVPVAMAVLLVGQLRRSGTDPPRTAPLPPWTLWLLRLQAAFLVVLGVILFVAPGRAASMWPWALTPLTSQAVGAWLVGVGVGSAQASIEADLVRIRPGIVAYAVMAALQLVSVARYRDDIQWGKPSAWYYLAFVVCMLAVGVLGLLALRRARKRAGASIFGTARSSLW